jgi:hypothetical protein
MLDHVDSMFHNFKRSIGYDLFKRYDLGLLPQTPASFPCLTPYFLRSRRHVIPGWTRPMRVHSGRRMTRPVGPTVKPTAPRVPWYVIHALLTRRTSLLFSLNIDTNRESAGCLMDYV